MIIELPRSTISSNSDTIYSPGCRNKISQFSQLDLGTYGSGARAEGLGTRLRQVVADRRKTLAEVSGRPFLAYPPEPPRRFVSYEKWDSD
jgi:choline kinase